MVLPSFWKGFGKSDSAKQSAFDPEFGEDMTPDQEDEVLSQSLSNDLVVQKNIKSVIRESRDIVERLNAHITSLNAEEKVEACV